METDWIALDYWSELIPFNEKEHFNNGEFVAGVYVLNRTPDSQGEYLMYYPELVYTTRAMNFFIKHRMIALEYIDYVIVAPRVIPHNYFKKPLEDLHLRYHDKPEWYKPMVAQVVGRLDKMFSTTYQVAVLFNQDLAQGLRQKWASKPNTKVSLTFVSGRNGVWWLKQQVREPKVASNSLIRIQVIEEAKIRNYYRARSISDGVANCRILSHRCDCTIPDKCNIEFLKIAEENSILAKADRQPGTCKIEIKKS